MNIYELKLLVEPSDIYNKLANEYKEYIKEIRIINTTLLNDGTVEIECLALEDSSIDCNCRYKLLSEGEINLN